MDCRCQTAVFRLSVQRLAQVQKAGPAVSRSAQLVGTHQPNASAVRSFTGVPATYRHRLTGRNSLQTWSQYRALTGTSQEQPQDGTSQKQPRDAGDSHSTEISTSDLSRARSSGAILDFSPEAIDRLAADFKQAESKAQGRVKPSRFRPKPTRSKTPSRPNSQNPKRPLTRMHSKPSPPGLEKPERRALPPNLKYSKMPPRAGPEMTKQGQPQTKYKPQSRRLKMEKKLASSLKSPEGPARPAHPVPETTDRWQTQDSTEPSLYDGSRLKRLEMLTSESPKTRAYMTKEEQAEASKPRWQKQKEALKAKFPDGYNPRKRVSPDAIEGIRALHAQYPNEYTNPVLAQKFGVSPEAIRRILRTRWKPTAEEEIDRQERWLGRGKQIWSQKAALGIKPPQKWRAQGIVRDPSWNVKRGPRTEYPYLPHHLAHPSPGWSSGPEQEVKPESTQRKAAGKIL